MSYKKKNFGKRFFPEIFFGKRIGKRPFIIPGIPGIPESHPWYKSFDNFVDGKIMKFILIVSGLLLKITYRFIVMLFKNMFEE